VDLSAADGSTHNRPKLRTANQWVVEPHRVDAAPALGKEHDAAPALTSLRWFKRYTVYSAN
jgi:hypothetical protein